MTKQEEIDQIYKSIEEAEKHCDAGEKGSMKICIDDAKQKLRHLQRKIESLTHEPQNSL